MLYLTVLIVVNEGKEALCNTYETAVLPIIQKHDGKLIYRIQPKKEDFITCEGERPYEIHFMSFPTHNHLNNFIKDDERTQFIALKKEAIKTSFIVKGDPL